MTEINPSKKKTELDWRKLSDDWRQSGLSQPEFCKRNDINYNQFVVWRSKFLRAAGLNRHQFKPVKVQPPLALSTQAVQIHLPSGVRIQVANGIDQPTLNLVLRSLGFPAC